MPVQISEVTAGQRPVSAVKIKPAHRAGVQQVWQGISPVLKPLIRQVQRLHRSDAKEEPHSTSIVLLSSFWISLG